ncbi:hypothetical protein DFR26_0515 [Paraperlucidibaca baekdonensis]|uniref:Condensation domain-containing protein n=1 Tax=Paraperlucidibaca baekdonensis TaxID=748120 RepID=A0A3E0H9F3_9GAMM|nr:hypothetical protein [Paraperlucidibaca baekdonensis]REH40315.1 hypothetical protein DFR26_0515 [Paraperlucidibaca baekdonensis]
MPSDSADYLAKLPALTPLKYIDRPVSASEYYHASVGASRHTLESPRMVFFILRGSLKRGTDGGSDRELLTQAIARVAAVNPVLRLRWHGYLGRSRWLSDGPLPRLRVLEHCLWDGLSSDGAECLDAPLSLRDGPCAEFIWAPQRAGRGLLILRSFHAVMDGLGGMHLLHELFRALRGEALLGDNAAFSDADLMRATAIQPTPQQPYDTCALTEPAPDALTGDDWCRLRFGPLQPRLLSQVAQALAEFAHQFSEVPVRIAVPVDLRKHVPGLVTSANFANMLFVRLDKGASAADFDTQLREQLRARRELAYPAIYTVLRWLPLRWFDFLLGRRLRNFATRKPVETAVISNMGPVDLSAFDACFFAADDFCISPMPGNAFVVLYALNGQINMVINLPRLLSSDGRQAALVSFLTKRFGEAV